MERTAEIIATDISTIPTLDTIQDKYDSLIESEAKKTINFLGKKTKRQSTKSDIQKMIDTVRKKAQTDEMIKPILQSLKYDLKAAGADVVAEIARLRFKLKKLGLGKELCEGQLKTFTLATYKIADNGAFITNDLFFYVMLLYERLEKESRNMIDSIEEIYVCNTSELFLNGKDELQEFFYEDSIPDVSMCGNLNTVTGDSITISIDSKKDKRFPGKLTYKGNTYFYDMVYRDNKPAFIMANKKYWAITVIDKSNYKYDININNFKLFHISKELKSGIKRVGKKKGLFVIGSKLIPTDVAVKNLLLNCDASFEYLITTKLNKIDILNLFKEKRAVPSFICNMENLLQLTEIIIVSAFMNNIDISDILENYKKYNSAFTLYRKLYTKLMSVICKYFDWFIEKVNYDRILELKKHVDNTLSYWEEISKANVETRLKEWAIKILTCNNNFSLEDKDNMILNFFSNLNELKIMLLKTRSVLLKIGDFSIDAEAIEPHLRALAVGYRKFMMNGDVKCFTIIRTPYAFMGNTIGNNTIADLVAELNRIKVETYRSSNLLLQSKLRNIRTDMALDYANLKKLTENETPNKKKELYERDTIIPERFLEYANMNISEKEIRANEDLASDIINIYNAWSDIAGKERKPKRRTFKKIKRIKKEDGTVEKEEEEITYEIKDKGDIKHDQVENGIAVIVEEKKSRNKSNNISGMDLDV